MDKKLLTNRQLRDFWMGLQTLAQSEQPTKLAFAIARNREKVRSFVVALEEATKPLEAFEEKRIALAREMADKDDDGQPIQGPGGQLRVRDMAEFERLIAALKKETGQDKKDKEVERLMEAKEEIEVYTIPFSLLPETMRPDLLEAVLPMLSDGEEPVRAEG